MALAEGVGNTVKGVGKPNYSILTNIPDNAAAVLRALNEDPNYNGPQSVAHYERSEDDDWYTSE